MNADYYLDALRIKEAPGSDSSVGITTENVYIRDLESFGQEATNGTPATVSSTDFCSDAVL